MKIKNFLTVLILPSIINSCVNLTEKAESSEILAYHLRLNDKWQINYCKSNTENQLPPDLIISPGIYNSDSLEYDLHKEGLARILELGRKNTQRLVFKKDTIALLSGLCWIVTHGNRDINKDYEELNKIAISGKLYLTCGHASNWVVRILEDLDIKAREVMMITLEEWNEYDDGHNMVEVLIGDKWVLFDIDKNLIFKQDGNFINLRQFQQSIGNNTIEMVTLSNDLSYQSGWQDKENYNLDFLSENYLAGTEWLTNWYKKNSHVIFIERNDTMYFRKRPEPEINDRILTYSALIKDIHPDYFDSIFYNN